MIPSQAVSFTLHGTTHFGEVLCKIGDQLQVRDLLPASQVKNLPPHTAKHEMFRLSTTRMIPYSETDKFVRLADLLSFRPGKSNLLCRQHYDPDAMTYSPPVPPYLCVCRRVINPEENYSLCLECPRGFHNECLPTLECPTCGVKVKIRKDDTLVIQSANTSSASEDQSNRSSAKRHPAAAPQTLQSMRTGVVSSLKSALSIDSPATARTLSEEIEQALFDATEEMDGSTFYTRQARALKFNLSAKDNAELRTAVLSGKIAPAVLVRMSSQEMANSKTKQLRLEKAGAEFIEKHRKLDPDMGSEDESDDPFNPDNH